MFVVFALFKSVDPFHFLEINPLRLGLSQTGPGIAVSFADAYDQKEAGKHHEETHLVGHKEERPQKYESHQPARRRGSYDQRPFLFGLAFFNGPAGAENRENEHAK